MSERIRDIDWQISQLQARKKKLEDKKKNQMSTILSRCGAALIPDEILAGAILDAVRAYGNSDNRVSQWRLEGQKVLKPGRGKKKFV